MYKYPEFKDTITVYTNILVTKKF
ncbi:hypothetical protein [Clostridium baratii]